MQPHDGVVLDQYVVGGGLGYAAAGEADDDDPALECDAFGRAVVNVSADRVEHHVGAPTSGDLLDLFHEVLRLVVQGVVRAKLTADLDFRVRAGGRNHDRPCRLAELDGGAPDPACPGVDEQRLTSLEVGPAMESEPPGLKDQRESGRLLEGHRVGDARDRAWGRIGDLCVAAARETCVVDQRHDAIAGLEAGGGRCADDLAAHLNARDEWELRLHLVQPRNHQRVGKVDRGGAYVDAYQALGRLARVEFLEAKGLRPAKLPHHPGLHRGKATAPDRAGAKWLGRMPGPCAATCGPNSLYPMLRIQPFRTTRRGCG